MVFDIPKIIGTRIYDVKQEKNRDLYLKDGRTFLVMRRNTIEVRCDRRLSEKLKEKYESVMESRYFGRGGIEIVLAGQFSQQELEELIRLSYLLTQ